MHLAVMSEMLSDWDLKKIFKKNYYDKQSSVMFNYLQYPLADFFCFYHRFDFNKKYEK